MNTDRELMQQALEALTHGCPPDCKDGMTDSGGVYPWGEAALIPCPNCEAITADRALRLLVSGYIAAIFICITALAVWGNT